MFPVSHLRNAPIGVYSMLKAVKLPEEKFSFKRYSWTSWSSPAGIAHLDPSLTNVYGDDLPHVETLEFYFRRVQPSMWAAGTASHILANLEKALAPFCPAAALRMYYLIIPALAMEGVARAGVQCRPA